jgi:hypothetical protein
MARAATAFMQRSGWTEFGCARLEDHARERVGRPGRWVLDLAAVGRGLEELPMLEDALAGWNGGSPLGLVAARLVSGVADGESAAIWIAVARTFSIREFKSLIRKAREAGSRRPPVGQAWVTRAQEITVKRLDDEIRAVERRMAEPTGPLDGATWHASLRRQVVTAQQRMRDFGRALCANVLEAATPSSLV